MNRVKKKVDIGKNANIGEKIEYLRSNKKMTQQNLAGKLKITRYQLGKYEDGTSSVPSELLQPLSKALDTSIDYLLGITKSKSSNIEIQKISEYTGLSDTAIEVLKELRGYAPEIIDTINYLIEQEEELSICGPSVTIPLNATEEEKQKLADEAEDNYWKLNECWDELHFKILSKISDYYNTNVADEMIYIDRKNQKKSKGDFETEFQEKLNTKAKISLEDIVYTKLLQEIEYQLKNSKMNRQKKNTKKYEELEKYIEKYNKYGKIERR